MELTPIQKIALESVAEIQDMKRAGGLAPDYVTIEEISKYLREELLEALRTLYRQKMVEFHKTVNGVPMFGLKQQI